MSRIIFVSIAIVSNLCVASELLEKHGFYPESMSEVKVPEQSEEAAEEQQQAKLRQRSAQIPKALTVAETPEPSRVLTISFLDQNPSLKYEPSQNGRWDQQWHHDIQVSQNNDTALKGLDTLIGGNDQEVRNFWQTTWKSFNFLQKSLLLELIYALGAQEALLPPPTVFEKVLELDWKDNKEKLYLPISKDESSQFKVLSNMIEDTSLKGRLIHTNMQYDTDFEKDHALKSLKTLFDFAHNIATINDVSKLDDTQKNNLRTLFAEASSKEQLQALLWANRFGMIDKALNLLIDTYVEMLCREVLKDVSVKNIVIITTPAELKDLVFEVLLTKIGEVCEDSKISERAARNTIKYDTSPLLKEEKLYAVNWLLSSVVTFESECTKKLAGMKVRKNIEEALLFYKRANSKKRSFATEASEVSSVKTPQKGVGRLKMQAYNWYSALGNTYKTGLKWAAGIAAGVGLTGIAAYFAHKAGYGISNPYTPTKQSVPSTAITRKLQVLPGAQ
jgi:hypothetical protein